MPRKYNTKHRRSPSNYPKRLADRGLSRTPEMPFTGMTTGELQAHFAKLPRYNWKTFCDIDDFGNKHFRQQRFEIGTGRPG